MICSFRLIRIEEAGIRQKLVVEGWQKEWVVRLLEV
jgi:hypothetical protein